MNMILDTTMFLGKFLYYALEFLVVNIIPKSKKDVAGEIVLITGAGSGLGRLLAMHFARLGATVVLWDINQEANMETCRLVKKKGSVHVFAYKCDCSNRQEVYRVADQVREEVGDVTILINNAGIVTGSPFLDIPDHMIEKSFYVNAISHFWTYKAFLPAMIKANHGHLVCISSVAGMSGISGLSDYCASKFAAFGFAESLFFELHCKKENKIKTTIVCPFFFNTGMFEGCTTKYPFLLPIMELEYVAQKVLNAILEEKVYLVLPKFAYVAFVLKQLISTKMMVAFSEYLGADMSMTTFKGRVKADEPQTETEEILVVEAPKLMPHLSVPKLESEEKLCLDIYAVCTAASPSPWPRGGMPAADCTTIAITDYAAVDIMATTNLGLDPAQSPPWSPVDFRLLQGMNMCSESLLAVKDNSRVQKHGLIEEKPCCSYSEKTHLKTQQLTGTSSNNKVRDRSCSEGREWDSITPSDLLPGQERDAGFKQALGTTVGPCVGSQHSLRPAPSSVRGDTAEWNRGSCTRAKKGQLCMGLGEAPGCLCLKAPQQLEEINASLALCPLALCQRSNYHSQFPATSRAAPKLRPRGLTDKGQEAVDFGSQVKESDTEDKPHTDALQYTRVSPPAGRGSGLPTQKF
ncbi:uncharacterized protein O8D03_007302 [Erethizon dorsatum]